MILKRCVEEAIKLLEGNATSLGVRAGKHYPQVWGRDGLICSLGMSRCKELVRLARLTIDSIAARQKPTGQLPNFIEHKWTDYGAGGCVDTSLWYPIAVLAYYQATRDKAFLKLHAPRVEKAIQWLIGLDVNNDYLLEVNEGADWMDCLLRSGRVLYDEVLFYGALKSTDRLRSCLGLKPTYEDIASKVKQIINLLFWPEEGNREALIKLCRSVDKDFETVLQAGTKPYYYAEIGLRRYDPRCDVYANTLAILFGVADRVKAKQILNFFQAEKVHEPFPVRVLHPPVQPTDAFRFWHFRDWGVMSWLQEPGNFQNGGIWPYVGGFYVILWPGSDAKRMLEKLACANKVGKIEWEFNEWLNLQGVPLGSPYQSWSAAMYILAYYSIQKKIKVLPQV